MTRWSIYEHHVATFYMKKSHYFPIYCVLFISLLWEGALPTSRRRISCFSIFFYCKSFTTEGSRDNVMTRLQAGRSGVRILAGVRDFFLFSKNSRPTLGSISLLFTVNRWPFPGCKAAKAWDWALNSIRCWGLERVELYLHSSVFLYDVYRDNCTFTFSTELTISLENPSKKNFYLIRAVFRPLYKKGNGVGDF